jgi:diketogulonate reductase-like aldo/keto reductase
VLAIGCMRVTHEDVLRAARAAGFVIFDTARAYAGNEELLARAFDDPSGISIVTKCGMQRPGGAWEPDGRAAAILEDVRLSRAALAHLSIDLLLLHAPDPRVAIATSVRAMQRAVEAGHARRIGLCNVSRAQIEEAMRVAPIAAVQVALGAFDDAPARGGLVSFCADRGIAVMAHSPLGGPKRAPRVDDPSRFLAYLRCVHSAVIPVVGVTRVETVERLAAGVSLDEAALSAYDARYPGLAALRAPPRSAAPSGAEVVMLMGIAGAGKSRAARDYESRGWERLNRDTSGGSLRELAKRLGERLAEGASRIVLDNTYLTRASRSDVVAIAKKHGARVRCVFFDTPVQQAQINVVSRMLREHGALPSPEEMARLAKKRADLGVRPTVVFRMARELEPPGEDEGFTLEHAPFERAPNEEHTRAGALVSIDALDALARVPLDAAILVVAWRPDADAPSIEAETARVKSAAGDREVELAVCTHPAGPPVCWCRPPLPGLWLAFAERRRIDPRKSFALGEGASIAAMARALGLALL